MEELCICYVEKELLEECLQMVSQDDTILAGHDPFKVSEQEVDPKSKGIGAEDGSEEQSAEENH